VPAVNQTTVISTTPHDRFSANPRHIFPRASIAAPAALPMLLIMMLQSTPIRTVVPLTNSLPYNLMRGSDKNISRVPAGTTIATVRL
jgi:hypothetical protein